MMVRRLRPLQASFLPLLFSLFSEAGRTCYLPNGKIEKNDSPCFPQNPESVCCGGGEYLCATNNLCARFDGALYIIGSCTDRTWNSPACPSYCYFREHIHNIVNRCDRDTYCCADGPPCNCTTKANTHQILDFLPPFSDLVGSSVALDKYIGTVSLLTPLGAVRSVAASTSRITTTPSTALTITTSSTPAATATSIQYDNGSNGDEKSLKVGLGVGIPLGLIAVVLGTALAWREMKRKARNSFQTDALQVNLWAKQPLSRGLQACEAPVGHEDGLGRSGGTMQIHEVPGSRPF